LQKKGNVTIEDKIMSLKERKNAIILAHNYQIGEVQDIADYVGDSLGLSQKAAKTDTDIIVFCGVQFMAETAAILCPDKKVLMPEITAGCPMANMITAEQLRQLKKNYPHAPVVCYVNTTAEVKAESDVCCTSSNAVQVVESFTESEIIFIPDQYLAHYVSTKTDKKIIPWKGFCPTHVKILPEHILQQKKVHPQAKVMVHPECTPPVIVLADKVLSTGGMLHYAKESTAKEIIVGTEVGVLHRLQKENQQKHFYPALATAICPNMKKTTLETILWSLEDMKYRITVPSNIRLKANQAIEKMLELK
jgi:quinolinate synthase